MPTELSMKAYLVCLWLPSEILLYCTRCVATTMYRNVVIKHLSIVIHMSPNLMLSGQYLDICTMLAYQDRWIKYCIDTFYLIIITLCYFLHVSHKQPFMLTADRKFMMFVHIHPGNPVVLTTKNHINTVCYREEWLESLHAKETWL